MFGWITGLFSGGSGILAKLAGAAIIAAIIGGLFLMWRTATAERDLARAQVSQLEQVNQQNIAALAKLQTDFQAAQSAAAEKARGDQRRADQLAQIEMENAHAQNGNRPVSPVVGRVLDELLEPATATSPNQGSQHADTR